MYKENLEKVIGHFSSPKYEADLQEARGSYFSRTGKVFEDEDVFETRISAFFEWYVFDRDLWDYGIPPIRVFRQIFGPEMTEEVRSQMRSMERTEHSLFMFLDRKGDGFRVRNLFNDQELSVVERRSYAALGRGDLLDARVINLDGKNFFSETLWTHPQPVRGFIEQAAVQARNAGREKFEELLFDLAYMKLKHERYQHLTAEAIYDWSTFTRPDGVNKKRGRDAKENRY